MEKHMKFQQLNEAIDWILKGESLEEQVIRAKDLGRNDATFVEFIKIGVLPEMKLQGLPEGLPDTYKVENDMPDGISDTTARNELRRIKNFCPGGTMAGLKPAKKEMLWIGILEGLHWKEAEVLTLIKDQTLFTKYPALEVVLAEVGIVARINKPEKKESKPRAPRKFKVASGKVVDVDNLIQKIQEA